MEVTGSLQTKRDVAYVVMSYKDSDNKWKQKWVRTDLTAKEAKHLGKKKEKDIEDEYVKQFKKELEENSKKQIELQKTDTQILENYRKMPFLDYIAESLREFKSKSEETTYDNWCSIYKHRITGFFTPIKELKEQNNVINEDIERKIYYEKQLTIAEVTSIHLQFFFDWLYDCRFNWCNC